QARTARKRREETCIGALLPAWGAHRVRGWRPPPRVTVLAGRRRRGSAHHSCSPTTPPRRYEEFLGLSARGSRSSSCSAILPTVRFPRVRSDARELTPRPQ